MPHVATPVQPDQLFYTDDEEANRLLATDATALLIGWVLDQQVTVQKAFAGPLELKRRIGTLDPATIAAYDTVELEDVFAAKPALHRFPQAMARRVQGAMQAVVEHYGGDASRIWNEARDYEDLRQRLGMVPGFGELKVLGVTAMLVRRFGMDFTGWEEQIPPYGSLADVTSTDELKRYQTRKRAYKAARRAAKATNEGSRS